MSPPLDSPVVQGGNFFRNFSEPGDGEKRLISMAVRRYRVGPTLKNTRIIMRYQRYKSEIQRLITQEIENLSAASRLMLELRT